MQVRLSLSNRRYRSTTSYPRRVDFSGPFASCRSFQAPAAAFRAAAAQPSRSSALSRLAALLRV